MQDQPEGGRPRICDAHDRRRLAQIALSYTVFCKRNRKNGRGCQVLSGRTLKNNLKVAGILKLIPKATLHLIDDQKARLIAFCDAHMGANLVAPSFTDESSFCLGVKPGSPLFRCKPRQIRKSTFTKNHHLRWDFNDGGEASWARSRQSEPIQLCVHSGGARCS